MTDTCISLTLLTQNLISKLFFKKKGQFQRIILFFLIILYLRPFKSFLALENNVFSFLFKKEISDANITEVLIKIEDVAIDLNINGKDFIDFEILKCFVNNFSMDFNSIEVIKVTIAIEKLPDLRNLAESENYKNLIKQPFRSRSLLEIYLKKFLLKKTNDFTESDIAEFDFWLGLFLNNHKLWQENENLKKKYPVCFFFFFFFKTLIIFRNSKNWIPT